MKMSISQETYASIAIFSLSGKLDSGTSPSVEKKIHDAILEGQKQIVLDLSALEYLSSAGIRVLVHCYKSIEKSRGVIVLACVPKPIENVLYITGFLPYFQLYKTRELAIEALKK